MNDPRHALLYAALVAVVALGWCAWGLGRRLWRSHLLTLATELAKGHLRLRRRLAGLTIKDQTCIPVVVPAETMRGYVWIRVAGRPPRRGERPLDAHDEQMGWALTKCGANRKMRRTPLPQREEQNPLPS